MTNCEKYFPQSFHNLKYVATTKTIKFAGTIYTDKIETNLVGFSALANSYINKFTDQVAIKCKDIEHRARNYSDFIERALKNTKRRSNSRFHSSTPTSLGNHKNMQSTLTARHRVSRHNNMVDTTEMLVELVCARITHRDILYAPLVLATTNGSMWEQYIIVVRMLGYTRQFDKS